MKGTFVRNVVRRIVEVFAATSLLATAGCGGDGAATVNQGTYQCLNVRSDAASVPFTSTTATANATEITIDHIVADVDIQVTDDSSTAIRYTFEAPAKLQSALTHHKTGKAALGLGFNCSTNMTLDRMPQLTMTVGRGAALHLGSSSGDVTIGDINGPLWTTVSGSGNVTVGKVTTLSADLSGSGDLKVDDVSGPIDATASGSGNLTIGNAHKRTAVETSGSGDIVIGGEHLPYLSVDASSSGDITFAGDVDEADLTSSGSGDIRIRSVDSVRKDTTGSGEISIG